MPRPYALIIFDGFGYRKDTKYNAIAQAYTPTIDYLLSHYPHCLLHAAGEYVGLPPGYIGNSEVGHMTIGAGQIIKQSLTIINEAIENKSFFQNTTLIIHLEHLKRTEKTLHLIGLLSDAGVHSNINHLLALIKAAHDIHVKRIIVDVILDGRDTTSKSAFKYLRELDGYIKQFPEVAIGSIHGRFYAMDRDKNFDRTDQSINILTTKTAKKNITWQEVLEKNYAQNISDEFIPPTQLSPENMIHEDDGIIIFNFRSDRSRQLKNQLQKLDLNFVLTMVPYETSDNKSNCLFETSQITNTLLDVLAKNNKTVFAVAETEKYAHVTYFFNGGHEQKLDNETRVVIPSIKTKNYVDCPCMSAPEITNAILKSLKDKPCDFYLVNYANADMVGHSGDMQATIKAVECLDKQLAILYEKIVKKYHGTLYITADHGNAELMYDEKSMQPSTSHTENPVPFIYVTNKKNNTKIVNIAQLADIKDFILKDMGII